MSVFSVPRPRLPDQISIEFGPADLLGRAFLALDRAARERGVYLSVSHDMADLGDVNRRNRKQWYPLPPMFDASLWGDTPESAFWICGVDGQGDVVLTHACRLYGWPHTTLLEEFESMRFFYRDPETQKGEGESCAAASEAARDISGRVCYSGAVWVRPDFRGLGLAHITPRLVRAYSLSRWYPDFSMGMVDTGAAAGGSGASGGKASQTYGWKNVDTGLRWTETQRYRAELNFAFGWLNRDETVADLKEFTSLPESAGVLVV